jgi:hypothetical protein
MAKKCSRIETSRIIRTAELANENTRDYRTVFLRWIMQNGDEKTTVAEFNAAMNRCRGGYR